MYEDTILETLRQHLRDDETFVALIGRTQDIEISREGRPNAFCKDRFCGLWLASSTNLNPLQMSGARWGYDIEAVLTRKIEFRPKDVDKEYLYSDGAAMPKVERRLFRLTHQSIPLRRKLVTALEAVDAEINPAIDGGMEFHGPRGGIEFRDADWFFASADSAVEESEGKKGRGVGPFRVEDKGPTESREFFGISRTQLLRIRILVAHREFRIVET